VKPIVEDQQQRLSRSLGNHLGNGQSENEIQQVFLAPEMTGLDAASA
jgi:hypothetical protein